jgi:hypothetical protein
MRSSSRKHMRLRKSEKKRRETGRWCNGWWWMGKRKRMEEGRVVERL